jgi:hypothetical protein
MNIFFGQICLATQEDGANVKYLIVITIRVLAESAEEKT